MMPNADIEKLRAALQAALDALPPPPKPAKQQPRWLLSMTYENHAALCRALPTTSAPSLAARFCLHAMYDSHPGEARQHLESAALDIARALAELEGR